MASTPKSHRNGAVGFIDWLDPSRCISTDVWKIRLPYDEQVPHEDRVDDDVHKQLTSTDESIDGECNIERNGYMPGKA